MAGTSYLTRMPLGIAGSITRLRDLTTEPVMLDTTQKFDKYGYAGKYDGDKFVPLEDGDSVDKVAGILVRPYPTQSPSDVAYIGVESGFTGDALKRGYICVTVTSGDAAAAKKGDPVYVRVAGATTDSPLGSFLLAPDSTAENTPQLTIAQVMGPGDAAAGTGKGHVEIAYNI
jgi:hypothetical protein